MARFRLRQQLGSRLREGDLLRDPATLVIVSKSASDSGVGADTTAAAFVRTDTTLAPDVILGGANYTAGAIASALQTFESYANGTTITTGSGGSSGNTAIDAVAISTGATVTADNTHARGLAALRLAIGTTAGASYIAFNSSSYNGGVDSFQTWFRVYVYLTAYPSTNTSLLTTRYGAAGATGTGARIQVSTTGTIVITDAPGSVTAATTAVAPLNQWFRVEGYVLPDNVNGVALNAGAVEAKLFSGANLDGTTPDTGGTVTATGWNTGGNAISQLRFGLPQSGPTSFVMTQDDIAISTTGYPGPSGVVSTVQDDPDAVAADTTYFAGATRTTMTMALSFPSPGGQLLTSDPIQEFRLRVDMADL